MNKIIRLLLFISTFKIMLLGQTAAQTAQPEVTLKVIPKVIKLAPNETVEVRVVVNNSMPLSVQEIQLSSFTDSVVEVNPLISLEKSLQPHGSLVGIVRIRKVKEATAAGNISFQVSYTWQPNNAPDKVQGVADGTLEVQDRQPEPIDKLATSRVETTIDLVREKHKYSLFLIVSNISNGAIKIKEIRSTTPEHINLERVKPDGQDFLLPQQGLYLHPQEARSFPYTIYADDAVQAGKHMLLFEVDVEQEQYGHVWKGTLIAAHKFSVGVLGESEILTAVGVPSFLLLPGCLIVVMFGLLWSRVEPKRLLNLDWKTPEFWMISILISLLAAILYPLITDLFGPSRDYLESYGFRDILFVWIGSIMLGAVGWVFYVGSGRLITLWRARDIPTEEDTPVELLRKLSRNTLGLDLDQVRVMVDGQPIQAFNITPRKWWWFQPETWVAPEIILHWGTPITTEDKEKLNQLKERYFELRNKNDAQAMANLIEHGHTENLLSYDWEQSLNGPTKVQETKPQRTSRPIVVAASLRPRGQ